MITTADELNPEHVSFASSTPVTNSTPIAVRNAKAARKAVKAEEKAARKAAREEEKAARKAAKAEAKAARKAAKEAAAAENDLQSGE